LEKRQQIDSLEVNWPLLGGETQRFAIVEGEEKWK
jgi:hypothetical protein